MKLIAEKRPALKGRLPSLVGTQPPSMPIAKVDTSIAEHELGIKFTSLEECILDTVDALVGKESTEWKDVSQ